MQAAWLMPAELAAWGVPRMPQNYLPPSALASLPPPQVAQVATPSRCRLMVHPPFGVPRVRRMLSRDGMECGSSSGDGGGNDELSEATESEEAQKQSEELIIKAFAAYAEAKKLLKELAQRRGQSEKELKAALGLKDEKPTETVHFADPGNQRV